MKMLFLCTGNSCRSQMAEGFARRLLRDDEVYSAGVAPTAIHPRAVQVMSEVGIDLSVQTSKAPDQTPWESLELVVTVCGNARQGCPTLPPNARTLHWPVDDPAHATGTEEEILRVFRRVRDDLAHRVKQLAVELDARGAAS